LGSQGVALGYSRPPFQGYGLPYYIFNVHKAGAIHEFNIVELKAGAIHHSNIVEIEKAFFS
jgi:hypothetical protein